jgi:hypothetical protein
VADNPRTQTLPGATTAFHRARRLGLEIFGSNFPARSMDFRELVRPTAELLKPENNEFRQFAPNSFLVPTLRLGSFAPCSAAAREFIFRFDAQCPG